jgi:hypothetical protein
MNNKHVFFIISLTAGRSTDDPKVRAVLQLKRLEIKDDDLQFLIRTLALSSSFNREGLENMSYFIPSGIHNEFMIISKSPEKVFEGIHIVPKEERSSTYTMAKRLLDNTAETGFRELTADVYHKSVALRLSKDLPLALQDGEGNVTSCGFFHAYNSEDLTIGVASCSPIKGDRTEPDEDGIRWYHPTRVMVATRTQCEQFLGGHCGIQ